MSRVEAGLANEPQRMEKIERLQSVIGHALASQTLGKIDVTRLTEDYQDVLDDNTLSNLRNEQPNCPTLPVMPGLRVASDLPEGTDVQFRDVELGTRFVTAKVIGHTVDERIRLARDVFEIIVPAKYPALLTTEAYDLYHNNHPTQGHPSYAFVAFEITALLADLGLGSGTDGSARRLIRHFR